MRTAWWSSKVIMAVWQTANASKYTCCASCKLGHSLGLKLLSNTTREPVVRARDSILKSRLREAASKMAKEMPLK